MTKSAVLDGGKKQPMQVGEGVGLVPHPEFYLFIFYTFIFCTFILLSIRRKEKKKKTIWKKRIPPEKEKKHHFFIRKKFTASKTDHMLGYARPGTHPN